MKNRKFEILKFFKNFWMK